MPLAETAKLTAQLNLKGDFNRNIGKAQKGLSGFSKSLDGIKGQAKQSVLTGVGMGVGIGAFGAATMAIGKTVDILGDAVRMAAEEEAAIASLSRAIGENDAAWDGNINKVEELISLRQNELAFSDGEQREGLRLLIGNTKDLTEAQKLLGDAMDFARFRGIDLRTSADLLGRAYAGNFATLSRYGVVLGENATAEEALAQIREMSAGQARTYAQTDAGKMQRASMAVSDAMEELGKSLLPIVGEFAGLAADVIPDLVQSTKDLMTPLADLADVIGSIPFDDIFDNASDVFDDTVTAAQDMVQPINDALGRDIGNDLANLGRIVATGGLVLGFDAVGHLADQVNGASHEFDKGAEMMAHYQMEANGLAAAAPTAADGIAEIAEAADWATSRIEGLAGALEHVATTSHTDVVSSFDSMKKAVREAAKSDTWAELNKQIAWAERRLAKAGQGDVRAVLSNFLVEARGQVSQRRQVSRANRGLGNTGVQGAGGPNIDFQAIIEAQKTSNTELGNTLALQLQTNAETNSTALATMGTEQSTAIGAAGAVQAAAITTAGANQTAALQAIPTAIASIPAPPAPIVDVDVHNNISATTVEHTTQKVVRTNRAREDTP